MQNVLKDIDETYVSVVPTELWGHFLVFLFHLLATSYYPDLRPITA